MKIQTVKLMDLRMAPRKVRLIASAIKGMHISEAQAFLSLNPRRGAEPVLKLLRSGIAAAKETKGADESKLFIKDARVDGGRMLKRSMARAQGRGVIIQKKTSHITITLAESEKTAKQKFTFESKIVKKATKEKEVAPEKKAEHTEKPKIKKEQTEKKTVEKSEKGFAKRVHRRKAV